MFHDDQHGTAIVTAAGLLNALEVQGKVIGSSRIVCMGAGAAATACMDLLIRVRGCARNIFMLDRQGDPQRPHRSQPVQAALRQRHPCAP